MRRFTPRQIAVFAALAAVVVLLLVNRAGHSGGDGVTAGSQPAAASATTVDDGDLPVTTSSLPATASSSSPATGKPSSRPATGDDGTDDSGPVLVQPTSRPDVQHAATDFVAAWLNTYGQSPESWRQGLLPHVTADLDAELVDADPASVPAAATAGPVTVNQQESLVGADAAVLRNDTKRAKLGVLHLTLVTEHGTWLVSQIDWTPAR